jgi:hypothetical protein
MIGGTALPSTPEPSVLIRGRRFHQEVQAAYVAGLLGVGPEGAIERTILRPSGRRERADLLHFVTGTAERQQVVIEIKSTNLEGRDPIRRRRLFRRHLAQLEGYLDVLLEDVGGSVESVVAIVLYRHRPDAVIATEFEEIAAARGIMVAYYDDMTWSAKP